MLFAATEVEFTENIRLEPRQILIYDTTNLTMQEVTEAILKWMNEQKPA